MQASLQPVGPAIHIAAQQRARGLNDLATAWGKIPIKDAQLLWKTCRSCHTSLNLNVLSQTTRKRQPSGLPCVALPITVYSSCSFPWCRLRSERRSRGHPWEMPGGPSAQPEPLRQPHQPVTSPGFSFPTHDVERVTREGGGQRTQGSGS